ncbi:hypothetical protein H0O00_05320 [Candidatus Micrarchaeota archaeon]|nr:hypothetical protein [Candidatus Micrarchaeota archaeon]
MDFIMGLLALTFIMALYILMWDSIAQRWNAAGRHTEMESSAYFAAESLMTTPGEPESWEMLPHIDGNVSAIGLVNGRNELSRMKLEKLVAENATSYEAITARLGMQRYEFGMRVTDLRGNKVYYEFGKFSFGMLNNSLIFDRLGMLDGEPVIVHMEVWGR